MIGLSTGWRHDRTKGTWLWDGSGQGDAGKRSNRKNPQRSSVRNGTINGARQRGCAAAPAARSGDRPKARPETEARAIASAAGAGRTKLAAGEEAAAATLVG